MTDEEFKEATKQAYEKYVREADGLSDDASVGTPPKFGLDARVYKNHGLTPEEAAVKIYHNQSR